MVKAQRARALVLMRARLRARYRLHACAELDRRADCIASVQRAALERHVDELGGPAEAIEMRFRLFEVLLLEHPKPDALAGRLILGALEREAVVSALLNPAQVDGGGGLVAHLQADHFGVEIAGAR